MPKIEINDKEYNVKLAITDEEKSQGLKDITSMPYNEGMLFVYDEPTEVVFWMSETKLPLDIIFINEYGEVISVANGEPMSEELIEEEDVKYVLELNADSGVDAGDDVDLSEIEEYDSEEDDDDESDESQSKMLVLDENGKVQMELDGNERIFSRKHTKILARLAKKAYKSKLDKDYKALGRKVFAFIDKQNTQEQEYV